MVCRKVLRRTKRIKSTQGCFNTWDRPPYKPLGRFPHPYHYSGRTRLVRCAKCLQTYRRSQTSPFRNRPLSKGEILPRACSACVAGRAFIPGQKGRRS